MNSKYCSVTKGLRICTIFSVLSVSKLSRHLPDLADAHIASKKACSLDFLQQMAEGRKKYLLRRMIPTFKVPTWPELSVKALYKDVMADEVLRDYFPDRYPKGRLPERQFFWGVIYGVKPAYARHLVHDAI